MSTANLIYQNVREVSHLVHNITNLVVSNFNADVLLAMGASLATTPAHRKVCDIVSIVQALVVNIGTLDSYWIKSMQLAFDALTQRETMNFTP